MKLKWIKKYGHERRFSWLEGRVKISPMIDGIFTIEEHLSGVFTLFFGTVDYDKKIKSSKSIENLKIHAERVIKRTAERLIK